MTMQRLIQQERQNLEGIIGLRERRVVGLVDVDVELLVGFSRHLLQNQPQPERDASDLRVAGFKAAYRHGGATALPPLAVVRIGSSRLAVRDGHHRLVAAAAAGLPVLQALLLEATEEGPLAERSP